MEKITYEIINSWIKKEGNVNSTQSILEWIKETNDKIEVHIEKVPLSKYAPWYYDYSSGTICNPNRNFSVSLNSRIL